jgi:hypothetical protein
MSHGRPRTIAVVPGGPTNLVTIEARSRDTLHFDDGRRIVLDRFTVSGVAWGGETVWIDNAGRLAGIATRAGNLTFEAVRGELQPLFSRLMSIAARDRVAELTHLSRRVRPLAAGTVVLTGATLIDGTGRPPVPSMAVSSPSARAVK